ncbi:MAG: hypothetical protein BWZ03_00386 [bacterium ADurb.BinA186]|nr:MAG: hypothetical protein BWZ03_00386 [bacterium ADurb.BinA186]
MSRRLAMKIPEQMNYVIVIFLLQQTIMSYTAFTALIFTIHHLAAVTALILALCISAMVFLLFIKRQKHRSILMLVAFFISLAIGVKLADEIFEREAISLEVVRTN